jgi:hypothetical protein
LDAFPAVFTIQMSEDLGAILFAKQVRMDERNVVHLQPVHACCHPQKLLPLAAVTFDFNLLNE